MDLKTRKDELTFSDFILVLIKLGCFKQNNLDWKRWKNQDIIYSGATIYDNKVITQWESWP